jgi:hypothetical protein
MHHDRAALEALFIDQLTAAGVPTDVVRFAAIALGIMASEDYTAAGQPYGPTIAGLKAWLDERDGDEAARCAPSA